jgi:uncharacterized membrane protein required for colicin V production
MTGLDLAIVITVCLSAAYGFWKGIVRAIVGIAGLLGSIAVAGAFYQALALKLWPDGGAWTRAAAYAIILIAILVIAAIVASVLARLVHMTPLGIVDRSVGLAAGLALALLGWALVLTLVVSIMPGPDTALSDSAVAQTLIRWLATARGIPPPAGTVA